MKAFLMYPDRDFDPDQLFARRQRTWAAREAGQELDLRQALPWNEAALRQDLGLDVLLQAMAAGDSFLFDVALVAMLSGTADPNVIRYRQHVLSDCVENESIIRDIYRITVEAIESERKSFFGFFSRYPASVLMRAVDVLQMFVGTLKTLRSIADQQGPRFESDGFSRFFTMLRQELTDDYFETVNTHLKRLKFRDGVLISASLTSGNEGTGFVLRKPHNDTRGLLERLLASKSPAYTFHLHPRDEAGAQAVSALRDRGVNLVANALGQSTDHILAFFQMLRTELAFYIGCLNLRERLVQLEEPICFPMPAAAGTRTLSFSDLYDASLALSMGRKVVGNDLNADGKNLFIVTGANTGGKSTFLRSIGLAHLMMQAGMFVPAESFSSEVCESLFTHYKREEDTMMESGKWDDELKRMSEIIDRLSVNSVLLFNESFASTNEREGSEIASQIVRALLERNIKVFYVTHLYHFARYFFDRRLQSAVFLRAERRPDGTRPFKLVVGEPLQTSYGPDLYETIFGNHCGAATSTDPIRTKKSATA